MERKTFKPLVIIIALLVMTSLLMAMTVDVRSSDEAGIRLFIDDQTGTQIYLPDTVGDWSGRELRICQNPLCRRQVFADDTPNYYVCPHCGGTLASASIEEREQLPEDTAMIKKLYSNVFSDRVFVNIVLSGKERSSIHRPQTCLVGQGNVIEKSEVIPVRLEDGHKLNVMVLSMLNQSPHISNTSDRYTYYAYWFVGKGRETPHHMERMFWMAADRIVKSVSHRWAYIGIAGKRQPEGFEHQEEIRNFVRELYPKIILQDES